PLTSAGSGRDANGRFSHGNKAGRGNPLNRKVQQLRNALLAAVKKQDFREVAAALLEKAKGGDVAATRGLFDRLLGKPQQALMVSDGDGKPLSTQTLIAVVLGALADMPEARVRVADRLMELENGNRDSSTGDGP